MPDILRTHETYRLYTKVSIHKQTRYFVSEKSTSLRRLQILPRTANLLLAIDDSDFVAGIEFMLEQAKNTHPSAYRDIPLTQRPE